MVNWPPPKSNGQCSVDGCDDTAYIRGWCSRHYERWKRHGSPTGGGRFLRKRGEVSAFILNVVIPFSGEKCLIWPFRCSDDGYAVLKGKSASAQICEMKHGQKPSAVHEAAHSCGKGATGCVNPNHLRWATPSENQADKIGHGTHRFGETSPVAKLTEQQAMEIKRSKGTVHRRLLSERFGVSLTTIHQIQRGTTWPHLP